ncbi:MAG: hypothetical protein A2033_02405 [Bacteroidetes bacterium GWA2_31_9]|nr:MAG: hypothetical protein A2033_02405 [Bacteroidetes bacterium GWA2_31_9]
MKTLKVKNRKGFDIISLDNILYCNSERNYTILNLIDNRIIKILYPITKIEENLRDENFIRIHKQYVANNKHIVGFNKKTCCITLINDIEIPVSVRKKSQIDAMIKVTSILDYLSKKTKVQNL